MVYFRSNDNPWHREVPATHDRVSRADRSVVGEQPGIARRPRGHHRRNGLPDLMVWPAVGDVLPAPGLPTASSERSLEGRDMAATLAGAKFFSVNQARNRKGPGSSIARNVVPGATAETVSEIASVGSHRVCNDKLAIRFEDTGANNTTRPSKSEFPCCLISRSLARWEEIASTEGVSCHPPGSDRHRSVRYRPLLRDGRDRTSFGSQDFGSHPIT